MLRRLFSLLFSREDKADPMAPISMANCLSDFAWKLFQLEPEENSLFSPASIFLALSMVHTGSDGKTRTQIGNVLYGCSPDDATIGKSLKLLMKALESVDEQFAKVTWCIANRIYLNRTFAVVPAYKKELQEVLHAELEQADFANGPKVCDEINAWVSQLTNDKIKNIISSVNEDMSLILLNAVYFKAQWDNEFMHEHTVQGTFHCSEEKSIKVPMMKTKSDDFFYGEDADWQLLGLPYTAKYLRMYVLLPKVRFALSKVEKTLDGRKLMKAISDTLTQDVQVQLPKFRLEKEMSLEKSLTRLGMSDVFGSAANLLKISDKPLRLSAALHKTYIDVDEKGTEAAGVTVVKIVPLSARLHEKTYTFIADHPFLFSIVDTRNKTLLFLGRYMGS